MSTLASSSRAIVFSLSAVAVLVSGCANMTDAQRSAAIGGYGP